VAVMRPECGLLNVVRMDAHMVVARAQVELGEESSAVEFVDGLYNKFPTVKIPETRRVYDKFHACF
jgi:hypothetical protein